MTLGRAATRAGRATTAPARLRHERRPEAASAAGRRRKKPSAGHGRQKPGHSAVAAGRTEGRPGPGRGVSSAASACLSPASCVLVPVPNATLCGTCLLRRRERGLYRFWQARSRPSIGEGRNSQGTGSDAGGTGIARPAGALRPWLCVSPSRRLGVSRWSRPSGRWCHRPRPASWGSRAVRA